MPFSIVKCRSCGGHTNVILDLGSSPIANAILSRPDVEPQSYALGLSECVDCTLVQNTSILPAELLFPDDYPYFASTSQSVLHHANNIADELLARLGKGATTLEVGSNDGAVQLALKARGITSIGVDPATGPALKARSLGCEVFVSEFTRSVVDQILAASGAVDAVHMSNVLAHVSDPSQLLRNAHAVLAPEGILMLEVQSWMDLAKSGAFDMVYHEHHCHFSLTSLARLLTDSGFGISGFENSSMQGGSLRVWCKSGTGHSNEVIAAIEQEKQDIARAPAMLRESYAQFCKDMKYFAETMEGKRLYGYGAAAKTVTILAACGVELPLQAVADAAPSKIGKYLPVNGIPIISPQQLKEAEPDAIILFAWNLASEIIPNLPSAEIWIPVPKLERIK